MDNINAVEFLAIPIAYLSGAIPFSYILGRLIGRVDLRLEGDGHISATAVYRLLGFRYFILTIILDVGKGALAVYIAQLFSGWQVIVLLSGFAAVAGHCWPVYIRFKGGLGATVIYGVLACLAIFPFLIAGAVGGLVLYFTRKSTLSTIVIVVVLSLVLFLFGKDLLTVLFPYALLLLQFVKRRQARIRAGPHDYSMDLYRDFKRKKREN